MSDEWIVFCAFVAMFGSGIICFIFCLYVDMNRAKWLHQAVIESQLRVKERKNQNENNPRQPT
jgi:hypothetical protein